MFGEDFGNPRLEGLQEVSVPDPVPYTPQTIGWLMLLIVLLGVAGWIAYRRYRRWRANRYRRLALQKLDEIAQDLRQPQARPKALPAIPLLVKQTALEAYPRHDVAELSGERWLAFLDESYGRTEFTQGAGRLLSDLSYQSPAALANLSEDRADRLVSLVRQWIEGHHVRV